MKLLCCTVLVAGLWLPLTNEARAQAVAIGAGQSLDGAVPALGSSSVPGQSFGTLPDLGSIPAPGNLGQPGGPPYGDPQPPRPMTPRGWHWTHPARLSESR